MTSTCLKSFEETNVFVPKVIVSGRSVLGLNVIHGTFKYDVSSCMPPESVITNQEYFIK